MRATASWRTDLATPNYSYEKRQRELAKKRKQEEKRQKKTERKDELPGTPQQPGEDTAPSSPPDNAGTV